MFGLVYGILTVLISLLPQTTQIMNVNYKNHPKAQSHAVKKMP